MKGLPEKAGSVGALVATAACPVCFPKLALIGAFFGLGALGAYETQLFLAAQALIVLAVAGHALSYLRHRNRWLLAGAITSGAAVFAGLYLVGSEWLAYAGLAGLVAASAADFRPRLRGRQLTSVVTCPPCGASRREIMPTDACLFMYDCSACGAVLRPKPGDCCVFCSYGSVKCPPMQTTA